MDTSMDSVAADGAAAVALSTPRRTGGETPTSQSVSAVVRRPWDRVGATPPSR